jgi:hypothetical protein
MDSDLDVSLHSQRELRECMNDSVGNRITLTMSCVYVYICVEISIATGEHEIASQKQSHLDVIEWLKSNL